MCAAANNSLQLAWLQIWVNMSRIYSQFLGASKYAALSLKVSLAGVLWHLTRCLAPNFGFAFSILHFPFNVLHFPFGILPESWLPLPRIGHVYLAAIWLHLRPNPGHHRNALGPKLRLAHGGDARQVRSFE